MVNELLNLRKIYTSHHILIGIHRPSAATSSAERAFGGEGERHPVPGPVVVPARIGRAT